MKLNRIATVTALLFAAGCIHRAPEPVVPQDKPHISWEISTDDTDHYSEKHACTSVKPSPCELRLGTAEKPVTAQFIIFMHPASAETVYTGVVEIGFLGIDRSKPSTLDVKQTVAPSRKSKVPIQAIITSRIPAEPGTYRVTMRIVATMSGATTTLEDAVSVTILPPR